MVDQKERALIEQEYMELYDLDPKFQGHQKDINDMRELDTESLKTRIIEAKRFNDYMEDCWKRNFFSSKGTETKRSGKDKGQSKNQ